MPTQTQSQKTSPALSAAIASIQRVTQLEVQVEQERCALNRMVSKLNDQDFERYAQATQSWTSNFGDIDIGNH